MKLSVPLLVKAELERSSVAPVPGALSSTVSPEPTSDRMPPPLQLLPYSVISKLAVPGPVG